MTHDWLPPGCRLDALNAAECGTSSGYNAHRRRGETACRLCEAAAREDARYYRATREQRRPTATTVAGAHKALDEHKRLRLAEFGPRPVEIRRQTRRDGAA